MEESGRLFPVELRVEEMEQEVDVDLGFTKHAGHRHSFVLQLQQILK